MKKLTDKQWAQMLYDQARAVSDGLQCSAAGDCYTFVGSMNDVEDLREVLTAYQYRNFKDD